MPDALRMATPFQHNGPCRWILCGLILLVSASCEGGVRAEIHATDHFLIQSAAHSSQDMAEGSHIPAPATHPLDQLQHEPSWGLDPALLNQALEGAAELPRLYGMIVARHGVIQAERHFRGPDLNTPTNVKSVSKSILSALIGLAIEDGALEGLDQPVAPFFSAYLDEDELAERGGITLLHLLTMQSGLESTSSGNYGPWVLSSNWVRHAITRPLDVDPGTRMIYSTGNSHLLSAALSQATRRSTHDFARERLEAPLGIRLQPWLRDPQGIFFGGNDMLISASDLYKFGEMYRNAGRSNGTQILPRDWVEKSWEVHARSPRNQNVYGLGWWGRDSGGYDVRFAWGYGGQFLFIVPALELTVVFTSDPVSPREGPHNQALHRMLDEFLVPAAIAGAAQAGPRRRGSLERRSM